MDGTDERTRVVGVTRRRFLELGVGASALAVAVACGTGNNPGSASASASPRQGGILKVGYGTDLLRPDGHLLGANQYPFNAQVYDTLLRYDSQLRPKAWLAEKFDLSQDGKKLTLVLRNDVTFHNGRKLTSPLVRTNIERVHSPQINNPQLGLLSGTVASVDTPDDRTAVLNLNRPGPGVYDLLTLMSVVDTDALADGKNATIGTGPFKFVDWKPGQGYRLTRNDRYWRPGLPHLDGVEVSIIADPQALVVQLQSGAVDLVEDAPPQSVKSFAGNRGFRVLPSAPAGAWYMVANNQVPPFDKKEVRQAINHVINRKRFQEQSLYGYGTASAIPWPTGSPAYSESKANSYAYDLNKAKALLKSAGVTGGSWSMTVPNNFTPLVQQATVFQADLETLGIKLDVQPLSNAKWLDLLLSRSYPGLTSATYSWNFLQPGDLPLMAFPFRAANNAPNFTDPTYASLVDRASKDVDPQQLKTDWAQLTDYLLDQSSVMTMAIQLSTLATTSRVHNAQFLFASYFDLGEAWLG